MEEQLILDFMRSNGRMVYEDGSIENLDTVGDQVMFQVRSRCGHYVDRHMIPLLEIVAWVYWKQCVQPMT